MPGEISRCPAQRIDAWLSFFEQIVRDHVPAAEVGAEELLTRLLDRNVAAGQVDAQNLIVKTVGHKDLPLCMTQ